MNAKPLSMSVRSTLDNVIENILAKSIGDGPIFFIAYLRFKLYSTYDYIMSSVDDRSMSY